MKKNRLASWGNVNNKLCPTFNISTTRKLDKCYSLNAIKRLIAVLLC